jgi:hypothetical protein
VTDVLNGIAPLTFMCGNDGKDPKALRERLPRGPNVALRRHGLGRPGYREVDAMGEVNAMAGFTENRREYRQRVLKGATIIKGISNSEIGCQVRNQHVGGAELRVSAEARVPEEFLLYVPADGLAYRSQLRWRKNERVGVQFTGSEPKPRLHYG